MLVSEPDDQGVGGEGRQAHVLRIEPQFADALGVGAAMGLSQDTIGALSSQLWGFFSTNGLEEQRMREIGLDPLGRAGIDGVAQ